MARDKGIIVWTPTTVAVDGTTTGPTIDLKDGYVGDENWNGGADDGFLGIEILAKNIVTGTGDGFTLTWKWEFSDDDSTYLAGPTIGVMAFDTDGKPLKADGVTLLGLTRSILRTSIQNNVRRYAHLLCVANSITGGESADTYANVADGVPGGMNDANIY